LAIRVYDLAKELKISSGALKNHLKDMQIEIKSHMNYIEDDVADKVRVKFRQEVEHIKKMESERKLIQQQLREKEKEKKKHEAQVKAESNPFNDLEIPKTPPPVQSPFRDPRQQAEKKSDDATPPKRADTPQKDKPTQEKMVSQTTDKHTPHTDKTERPASAPPHRSERHTPAQRPDRPSGSVPPERQVWQEKPHRAPGDRQHQTQRQDRPQQRDRQYQPGQPRTDRPPRTGESDRNHRQGTQRPQPYQQGSRTSQSPDRQNRRPFSQDRPYNQQPRTDRPHTPRTGGTRPHTPMTTPRGPHGVSFPKSGIVKPDGVTQHDDKVFGKKKANIDELGEKSKHIQAKIQNTKRRRKVDEVVVEIDEAVLEKNIKQTLSASKKRKKYKKEAQRGRAGDEITEITISEFTSVSELAKIIDITPSEIITKFFQMGKMVSINQRLDKDSLELICAEYELDIHFSDEFGTDIIQDKIDDLTDVDEKPRPPVVTIMGHVDHGKTSILDRIRNTKVVAGESGGITQHIGAYQAMHNGQRITFIDTPGHEAFTAMRARGANITDVAVIVVAANDGVKPQTVEAIDHAKAAGVTMIIAINKTDLPDANIDRTVASLLELNVFLEGFGGKTPWVKCSAITGDGIDELLEVILLSSELKEIKARTNGPGKGIVIESEKNARMGSKATILLQEGILKKGDNIVVGSSYGHVRKMENERSAELLQITPSDIAVVYGLNEVPKAGDILNVVDSERLARQIGSERLLIRQEREKYQGTTNLGNLYTKIKQNEMTELRLIVKADVDGSVEAVCDSIQKLSTDEIKISIIRKSVGGIIEADVNLASASEAIIIGFNVRANNKAKKLAEETGVEIKFYQIIFEAIEEIKKAMIGMLAPEYKEKILGAALVKQIFKIKKIGTIAGCSVEKGYMQSKTKVRLFRNDKVIYMGEMENLKHYNDEVKEVKSGSECGITIKNYTDIKEGDVIECYILEEIERKL
jgi:translation initiation factor IF-2